MPICPECRKSYEEGVVLCRDCRVPLVGSLAELASAHDEADTELVSLVPLQRTVPNAVVGAMWRGALESQGLHPIVRSNTLPAYGEVLRDWSASAWGAILVPEEELTEAEAVLEDFIATAAQSGNLTDEETSSGDSG